ncbi:MAG: late competence development ComFB family protein [Oscillibacter sp.]|nr:late competence development ComFB family protein [Oscillibacter sp.]
MPKNNAKTGKSSKTARVLSLLTDPAASLLGGSRGHRDEDDETEPLDGGSPQARGLDDAATESRIQASLAAQEDSLVTELFGKKEPARPRAETPPPAQSAAPAPPSRSEPDAQEPDPRTLELLSMLSNPSTLGNSAMPLPEEGPPPALGMDFADELTAGMPEQPRYEPEPEPEPETAPLVPQQSAPQQYAAPPVQQQAPPQQYAAPRQPTLQYAEQPAQQRQQPAPPQYAAQQQPTLQYAAQQPTQQYATQPAPQQQYAAQPAQSQQYAAQPAQQAAPRQKASPAAHAVKEKQEEFVCFNLTQALVEDKAEKLMKQFGMCTCNRCKVDVTAIALSNLPAKYVAMQNRDILPLLSMYEEKYSAAVTVQVMNACRLVMKRPHHGR